MSEHNDEYVVENCPACGERPDYCQGHNMMGDPLGYRILTDHDNDNHTDCHASAPCRQMTAGQFLGTFIAVLALIMVVLAINFGVPAPANAADPADPTQADPAFVPVACEVTHHNPTSERARECARQGWIIRDWLVIGPARGLRYLDRRYLCRTEDQGADGHLRHGCVWLAREQGNHVGRSYAVLRTFKRHGIQHVRLVFLNIPAGPIPRDPADPPKGRP